MRNLSGTTSAAILQVVKDSIRETYATSDIRADGQVVKIFFVNGMKFEVVPAFKNRWPARDFTYSDVNMGGRWLSTNPKAEQDAMDSKNKETNGSLKNPCKRIRYIRDAYYKSYHLSGIIIDSFVYDAIGRSQWPDGGIEITEWQYARMLLSRFNMVSACGQVPFRLNASGSRHEVDTKSSLDGLGKVLTCIAK